MAKQDDFVRITLRLPPDLHADLEHYAVDNSLNAEIIRRLRTTVQFDQASAISDARIPPNRRFARLRVELDAGDRAITWSEIQERVAAVLSALDGPVGSVQVEVFAGEMAVEKRARRNAVPEGGLERLAREREAENAFERLIREEAPEGMNLNRVLERIEAGEEPEAAFRAELREHLANGGAPKGAPVRLRQS